MAIKGVRVMHKKYQSTKSFPYIGNGAYCYANSTAMLLSAIGENISPSKIEVLSGVGLGAFIQKESNLIFFSNLTGLPDAGISKALEILGFSYKERASQEAEPAPFEELKNDLAKSPAVLGPVDMGYLDYDPDYQHHAGIDHYVLAFNLDDEEVHLHDPAGFPYVSLSLNQLKLAWKAEHISYRRDFYRYWTALERVENPTEEEIYARTVQFLKFVYQESEKKANNEKWIIGREAILFCADRIKNEKSSQEEIGHLTHFALPLGAKRALDFVSFFGFHDTDLYILKHKQARLFGKCHTLATKRAWPSLSDSLRELANTEEEFRYGLLSKK